MMLFSPLCPPEDPLFLTRILPSGRSMSSCTTTRSAIVALWYLTTGATESPERFMYVCGFTRITGTPASVPRAMRHLKARFASQVAPMRDAMRSTTSKPALWGVPAYSAPGLPSPAMTFTTASPRCA